MRVRFELDLGAGVFRKGEVLDLPAGTAKALVLAGYAVELTAADVGGDGPARAADVLVPDATEGGE